MIPLLAWARGVLDGFVVDVAVGAHAALAAAVAPAGGLRPHVKHVVEDGELIVARRGSPPVTPPQQDRMASLVREWVRVWRAEAGGGAEGGGAGARPVASGRPGKSASPRQRGRSRPRQ